MMSVSKTIHSKHTLLRKTDNSGIQIVIVTKKQLFLPFSKQHTHINSHTNTLTHTHIERKHQVKSK